MRETGEARRAIAFVDGQNLFHAVRRAFGYSLPNFGILRLARAVCASRGWDLKEVRFYVGVRQAGDEPFWCAFWSGKLGAMGREGVRVFTRALKYRRATIRLPDGGTHSFVTREEKGIDVRIAIDVIRMAHRREYEVAVLFSQDEDFSEIAREIRAIAAEQGRWIKIASAYPEGRTKSHGINFTDWIPIDRTTYDACIDQRAYPPKEGEGPTRGRRPRLPRNPRP
ncbi:MAG TPA: NYN domain-containing protein [Planctomycetota bacterium]|jgi:uncharacterized LabA/DUF88 family protein|nr:NYN domain-containing protein [Planctomycetota bacterium]